MSAQTLDQRRKSGRCVSDPALTTSSKAAAARWDLPERREGSPGELFHVLPAAYIHY